MRVFKWERAYNGDESFLIKVGMEARGKEFNLEDFMEEEIYDIYDTTGKVNKEEVIKKFKSRDFQIDEVEPGEIVYIFLSESGSKMSNLNMLTQARQKMEDFIQGFVDSISDDEVINLGVKTDEGLWLGAEKGKVILLDDTYTPKFDVDLDDITLDELATIVDAIEQYNQAGG